MKAKKLKRRKKKREEIKLLKSNQRKTKKEVTTLCILKYSNTFDGNRLIIVIFCVLFETMKP